MSRRSFKINNRRPMKTDGFLKVDAIDFQHLDDKGQPLGKAITHEVMSRGNSAAILLQNVDTGKLVLVRQLRVAVSNHGDPADGCIYELPGGGIEPTFKSPGAPLESAMACARREAKEETGYVVTGELEKIATILPSPGGTSEEIHIFFGQVQRSNLGSPASDPKEHVEVVEMTARELSDLIGSSCAVDAKLLVAAQWFASRRPKARKDPLEWGQQTWTFKGDLTDEVRKKGRMEPRVIGIQHGRLDDITGIDIWINAENTDMQMARFFDTGISARIRYLGAAKSPTGIVYEDSAADALDSRLRGQMTVKPGAVVRTPPGEPRYTHGVKHVMHVACAQHSLFGGLPRIGTESLEGGFEAALREAYQMSRSVWHRYYVLPRVTSILAPLIGAGNAGHPPEDVAEIMVKVAVRHLKRYNDAHFRKIYFLAYNEREKAALEKAIAKHLDALEEWPDGGIVRPTRRPPPPPPPPNTPSSTQPSGNPNPPPAPAAPPAASPAEDIPAQTDQPVQGAGEKSPESPDAAEQVKQPAS